MYRLEIDSFDGIVIVQTSEFAFLADVQAAVKAVINKHEGLIEQKVSTPIAKPAAKRGRGRPAGSKNKK